MKGISEYMDWPRIEAILYGEEDRPCEVLGTRKIWGSYLVQTFCPGAEKVFVVFRDGGKRFLMEQVEDDGYFAIRFSVKKLTDYYYEAEFPDGSTLYYGECYDYTSEFTEKAYHDFISGTMYNCYENLGARYTTINGEKGVLFRVWVPEAIRVSVCGSFNKNIGHMYPMNRIMDDVFELFVPGVEVGDTYQYEVALKGGITFRKNDPYTRAIAYEAEEWSVITDDSYPWKDDKWMQHRKETPIEKQPINIYKVDLEKILAGKEEATLFEVGKELIPYVKKMGYTHIQILPLCERVMEVSKGYQTNAPYAIYFKFGSASDVKRFIDLCHREGIGVILEYVPSYFCKDSTCLSFYNGKSLYEPMEPFKREHPLFPVSKYDFNNKRVVSYVISNMMYWINEYHIDGLYFVEIAYLMYLDYAKEGRFWQPNIYGGNEYLQAISGIKQWNQYLHQQHPDVVKITSEPSLYPGVTDSVADDGLGFDLMWYNDWYENITEFCHMDPFFRKGSYENIMQSLIYIHAEKFVLPLSSCEWSLPEVMFGETEADKMANLRLLFMFYMLHPGKKELSMGQEIFQKEWQGLEDGKTVGEDESGKQFCTFIQELNQLYKEYPGFYALENRPETLEWINNTEKDYTIYSFMRKTNRKEDMLLAVCNFTPVPHENYQVGVPFAGKYKEIFNSDKVSFGGTGVVNTRIRQSKEEECDGRYDSIRISVPPLGVSVFKYVPDNEKLIDNKNAKNNQKNKEGAAE